MSVVMTGASMSLDGYISGSRRARLRASLAWVGGGDVEVRTTDLGMALHMTEVGAAH